MSLRMGDHGLESDEVGIARERLCRAIEYGTGVQSARITIAVEELCRALIKDFADKVERRLRSGTSS